MPNCINRNYNSNDSTFALINNNALQNIQQHIQHFFTKHAINSLKVHVLMAVSGGIDSMVLLHAIHNLQIACTIAHCNFQLRNDESNRDEQFVQGVANEWQIPILKTTFNTQAYAQEHALSIQEAARILRYRWFEEQRLLLEKELCVPVYIATAHHANDSVETSIFNFSRGTGISGLHGIKAINNKIIRPLITVFKESIEAYATSNNISWVTDSSNISNKYSRNSIRNEVLPLLEKIAPQAIQNIHQTIEHLQVVEKVYRFTIEKALKKIITFANKEHIIAIPLLLKHPFSDALFFEIAQMFQFSSAQVNELKKLCLAQTGSYIQNNQYQIINNRNTLIVTAVITKDNSIAVLTEPNSNLSFTGGNITTEIVTALPNNIASIPNNIAYIDANSITWPLVIRKPKQGDYFYPLGLNKKKKISRFCIDAKLSAVEKNNIWLIESNQKIIWIIGHRINHRCSVQPNTNYIVKFTFSPAN